MKLVAVLPKPKMAIMNGGMQTLRSSSALRSISGRSTTSLVHDKGHQQQPAGQQQADDGAGVQPVEPVALIEAGIDQRQSRRRRR